jgi:hypothetical protein
MNVTIKEALQKIETLKFEAGPKLERLSPLINYLKLISLQVPSHLLAHYPITHQISKDFEDLS